jgi:hypothetical protein
VGRTNAAAMRRLLLLALLALAVLAVPAVAQPTDTTGATAACDDGDDTASAAAATTYDGGVPAGTTGDDGGSSGGTPVVLDAGTSVVTTGAGDVTSGAAEAPGAVVAQEPEPQPEGPGQEQPGQPGGEPQQPTPGVPEVPGGEAPGTGAPGAETGGGLPVTGIEALQLALLGFVLLLVGARLRVLALRRRVRPAAHGWSHAEAAHEEAPVARSPEHAYAGRDDWSFPDPSEPAPTGLLPSTATARRHARGLAFTATRD